MAELKAGDKAPSFDLSDEDENKISLKDLKGNWVVFYFGCVGWAGDTCIGSAIQKGVCAEKRTTLPSYFFQSSYRILVCCYFDHSVVDQLVVQMGIEGARRLSVCVGSEPRIGFAGRLSDFRIVRGYIFRGGTWRLIP